MTAAENKFKSKFSQINYFHSFSVVPAQFYLSNKLKDRFFSDLPPGVYLDDLASLLTLDTKNIDIDKLGADTIKEQQQINLKFSLDKVAIIPEDWAQRMLAGVSHLTTFERDSNLVLSSFEFERVK